MARLVFIASLFLTLVASTLAQTVSYLTLEGAAAGTRADLQKNGLQLDSWTWGGSNAVNLAAGGAGAGKAQFEAVTVTRKIDANTPLFLVDLGSGKRLTSATITVASSVPGGATDVFPAVYTFTNVIITSQDLSSDNGSGGMEKLAFAYGKVSVTYTDPNTRKATTGSWNVQANTQNKARAIGFEA